MSKVTPRPWQFNKVGYGPDEAWCIFSTECAPALNIARTPWAEADDAANAAHIVKCVNMHEELVNCLKDAILQHEQWRGGWVDAARKLLAKAEADE